MTYSIFNHAQLGHTPGVNRIMKDLIQKKRAGDDDLRATWERERQWRPHWPDNFHACMADPLIRGVIETLYRHVPAIKRRGSIRQLSLQEVDQNAPPASPAPPPGARSIAKPVAAPMPVKRAPWPFRDVRSAQANDRDDTPVFWGGDPSTQDYSSTQSPPPPPAPDPDRCPECGCSIAGWKPQDHSPGCSYLRF